MALRSVLAGLMAAFIACGVAGAEPKHPKRLHVAAPKPARVVPNNPCADPDAVCRAGTYIGRDPDPRIRSQLPLDMGTPND
jgi:hypothetical protein